MAKYQQPFEETQALYDEKIRASGLDAYINITILSSNKAKEIVTLVKPNELFNYVTKMISISLLMTTNYQNRKDI
jgi:hypothetical protein